MKLEFINSRFVNKYQIMFFSAWDYKLYSPSKNGMKRLEHEFIKQNREIFDFMTKDEGFCFSHKVKFRSSLALIFIFIYFLLLR